MHNFKELIIWQKAIDFAVQTYKVSGSFPQEEKYGLTNQLRRSAVSIASNIAEGSGRNGNKEFAQFLGIATGSGYEAETQIIIANKLGFISNENSEEILNNITEIHRMMYVFSNKIKGIV